jgi:Na+/proline symporter
MIYFLTSQSIWVSGVLVVGLGTLLSMLGPALVRRYVDIKRLTANNEVAGFKFSTIGVLYAVLIAFAIIVVWQKFSDAEVDVVHEAGAAENIYRLSQGLTDKGDIAVRDAVAN